VTPLAAVRPRHDHGGWSGGPATPRGPGPGRGLVRTQVLLVDRDEAIGELAARSLEGFAARVVQVPGVREAQAEARSAWPDVLVVDLAADGLGVVEAVRRLDPERPLAAVGLLPAADPLAEAYALEAGLDDCLAKPLRPEVFRARVRRLVARRGRPERLTAGDLALDASAHRVWRAGRSVALTRTEFALLRVLLEHRGTVLSKERLYERVWGFGAQANPSAVEVAVCRLRRKLGPPDLIRTLRGVGYVLDGPPEG
jgi:DNA-binding response OmpR family regulator